MGGNNVFQVPQPSPLSDSASELLKQTTTSSVAENNTHLLSHSSVGQSPARASLCQVKGSQGHTPPGCPGEEPVSSSVPASRGAHVPWLTAPSSIHRHPEQQQVLLPSHGSDLQPPPAPVRTCEHSGPAGAHQEPQGSLPTTARGQHPSIPFAHSSGEQDGAVFRGHYSAYHTSPAAATF